ncbi:hypothetical protein DSO57_1006880 [Entomophthora muscae]|uniref:Uncharacterized protein n=1 Tax=Entomophthora muscae TaxID=34485 RepID=A0ACC2T7V1_9FUNG|nr:hypothetical protein DSO57_1006880 [Entomophthora muscae]
MKFFCLLLVASSVAGTATELRELYNEYSNKHNEHACAVFEEKPDLGKYRSIIIRFVKNWVYEKRCKWFDCKYIICIPKASVGEFIVRQGDGGFDRWIYDGVHFERDNAKITIRSL